MLSLLRSSVVYQTTNDPPVHTELGNHRIESKRVRFPVGQTKDPVGLVNPIGITLLWWDTEEKEKTSEGGKTDAMCRKRIDTATTRRELQTSAALAMLFQSCQPQSRQQQAGNRGLVQRSSRVRAITLHSIYVVRPMCNTGDPPHS